MAKPVIWSQEALSDFIKIADYIAEEWGTETALNFVNYTERITHQIQVYPKLYPLLNSRKPIRQCVLNKFYTLYYRERRSSIDVLRIYDNRQNPKSKKL